MKKTIASLALAGLATLAFGQDAASPAPVATPAPVMAPAAAQNQIDVGAGFYDTDPTGVYSNFQSSSNGGQAAKYGPSANWNGKYTFTLPVNSTSTVKFALADDGWYGFYSGSASFYAQESGQTAGKVTPTVEYLGFGFDVAASVPFYYYSPSDAGGYNELKYAYKEAGYLPVGPAGNSKNYPLNSNNSIITTGNLGVTYKYSFDKTTWVSGGVQALYAFSPTPWLTDVLPKVSGAAYGFQLDVQYDFYNAYNDDGSTASKGATYYDTYLEPKLTYDFGFLNLVTGLKLYTQARISLVTNNPAYNTPLSTVASQPFHDTYIQPGVNYTLGFDKFGSVNFDAGWRFNKVDNVGSVAGGNGHYTGITSNPNDVAPYSDLRLAAVYTYKF